MMKYFDALLPDLCFAMCGFLIGFCLAKLI